MVTHVAEGPGGGLYIEGISTRQGKKLFLLSDVSQMVNEFAGGVFLTRAAWHAGEAKAKDPLELIDRDAKRCGDVILGRDPHWAPGPWNDERRLGAQLRVLLPELTAQCGDPGKALFLWLAGQLVEISQEVEEDRLSEDDAKPHIARLCVDVAGRIVGTGNLR